MSSNPDTSNPSAAVDEPRIDATFRNGSVTAVGIVTGFSLGFLSQWAANPTPWSKVDIPPTVFIVVGILLQGKSLADLLSINSLKLRNYERARLNFLWGLALVSVGIAMAIMLDILGLGPRTLS